MNAGENENVTSISEAKTIEEIADFWNSHSLADYWEKTREVSFQVRATRRRRITIDPEVFAQIEALAHVRGVSPETLVNLWLAEQVRQSAKAQPDAPLGRA
jgi:hypothetical protein